MNAANGTFIVASSRARGLKLPETTPDTQIKKVASSRARGLKHLAVVTGHLFVRVASSRARGLKR